VVSYDVEEKKSSTCLMLDLEKYNLMLDLVKYNLILLI
jgi:hypothetical protein